MNGRIRRLRQGLGLATVMAILLVSPFAHGGDVEDLRAAVEKELQAYGNRDCRTVISLRADTSVVYTPRNPEPVVHERASDLERCKDGTFDNWNQSMATKVVFTHDYQFRVMDTTGVVYGRLSVVAARKEGETRTRQWRRLETWVKVDGAWRRAALAIGEVPSGPPAGAPASSR